MKILISYFYQIRFFKPNMIPLSTAAFDPKWFHQGKGYNFYFKDKNNVYNGLRAEPFVPKLNDNSECMGRELCQKKPENCSFLSRYAKQLDELSFSEIMQRFENLGNRVKEIEKFEEEPVLVLIVYETPDNPCSERVALKQWFKKNGYELHEFER